MRYHNEHDSHWHKNNRQIHSRIRLSVWMYHSKIKMQKKARHTHTTVTINKVCKKKKILYTERRLIHAWITTLCRTICWMRFWYFVSMYCCSAIAFSQSFAMNKFKQTLKLCSRIWTIDLVGSKFLIGIFVYFVHLLNLHRNLPERIQKKKNCEAIFATVFVPIHHFIIDNRIISKWIWVFVWFRWQ